MAWGRLYALCRCFCLCSKLKLKVSIAGAVGPYPCQRGCGMTALARSCKRSGQRPRALPKGNSQKKRGWRPSLLGPLSPAPTITRVALMTSASISGIHGRSNQYHLPSILVSFGLSPCSIPSFRMKLCVFRFLCFFRKLIQSFP